MSREGKDKDASTISFCTVKGKRVVVQNPKSQSTPVVTRTLRLHTTPFLTIEFWLRHKYTLSDIELTLKSFQPYHLWGMCMKLGLPPSRASVQPAYATDDTLIFGAKAPAYKLLMQYVKSVYPASQFTESVLTRRLSRHKPMLPVHKVTDAGLFKQYLKHSVENGNPQLFRWSDILVVPRTWEESKYLLMTAVVEEGKFVEEFGPATCPGLEPNIVIVKDRNYVLLEESFYLTCEQSFII